MRFTIYSKDSCPWCDRAKQILESLNFKYIEYRLGDNLLREEFIEQFGDTATFPRIFCGDDLVGGCTDLILWVQATQS